MGERETDAIADDLFYTRSGRPHDASKGQLRHSAVRNHFQHDADFQEAAVPGKKPKISLKSLRIFWSHLFASAFNLDIRRERDLLK